MLDRLRDQIVGTTRYGALEHWTWPPGSRHQRPEGALDAVEIGWTWLAPSAQRTAVNSEAKLLLLDHAFGVLRVRRVTLATDARNERSRQAIERLGATLDGVLRATSPAADDIGPRDTAFYSILDREWPAARARLEARRPQLVAT